MSAKHRRIRETKSAQKPKDMLGMFATPAERNRRRLTGRGKHVTRNPMANGRGETEPKRSQAAEDGLSLQVQPPHTRSLIDFLYDHPPVTLTEPPMPKPAGPYVCKAVVASRIEGA